MTNSLPDYDAIAEVRHVFQTSAKELAQKLTDIPQPELTETQKETADAIAEEILDAQGLTENRSYYTFHDVQRIARLATKEGMKYALNRTDALQGES